MVHTRTQILCRLVFFSMSNGTFRGPFLVRHQTQILKTHLFWSKSIFLLLRIFILLIKHRTVYYDAPRNVHLQRKMLTAVKLSSNNREIRFFHVYKETSEMSMKVVFLMNLFKFYGRKIENIRKKVWKWQSVFNNSKEMLRLSLILYNSKRKPTKQFPWQSNRNL